MVRVSPGPSGSWGGTRMTAVGSAPLPAVTVTTGDEMTDDPGLCTTMVRSTSVERPNHERQGDRPCAVTDWICTSAGAAGGASTDGATYWALTTPSGAD